MSGSGPVATPFGAPLAQRNETLFAAFVAEYAGIVQLAVEEAITRTDRQVYPKLRRLAWRAGAEEAVPQDLIGIHLSALAAMIRNKPHTKARACVRHSRLLLVKTIGELALYYRDRASRASDAAVSGSVGL